MPTIIFHGRSFTLSSPESDAAAVVLWGGGGGGGGGQVTIDIHLSCPQIATNAEQFRKGKNP